MTPPTLQVALLLALLLLGACAVDGPGLTSGEANRLEGIAAPVEVEPLSLELAPQSYVFVERRPQDCAPRYTFRVDLASGSLSYTEDGETRALEIPPDKHAELMDAIDAVDFGDPTPGPCATSPAFGALTYDTRDLRTFAPLSAEPGRPEAERALYQLSRWIVATYVWGELAPPYQVHYRYESYTFNYVFMDVKIDAGTGIMDVHLHSSFEFEPTALRPEEIDRLTELLNQGPVWTYEESYITPICPADYDNAEMQLDGPVFTYGGEWTMHCDIPTSLAATEGYLQALGMRYWGLAFATEPAPEP